MNIPIQLKDQRFCKVQYKEKKPFEKAWKMLETEYTQQEDLTWKNNSTGEIYLVNKKNEDQKEIKVPYTGPITNYNYETISKFQNENYGVICGINQLGILDDDSSNKILMELFEKNFGKTFRVRNHYYIKLKNWDGKKIIFYSSTGKHLGELQGNGTQAVGPGSVHPSGEIYDLREDLPIKEIEFEDFMKVFGQYTLKKEKIIREHNKTSWSGDDIKNIPISSIISFGGLNDRGNRLQGSHPKHGSVGGSNFVINNSDNNWYCFRCNSGGGPSELIAVMEGIIDCSDAGPSCFSSEQGQEVIKVAREKYGLKVPDIEKNDKIQPKGWGKCLGITKICKDKGIECCPACGGKLRLIELKSMFKCEKCLVVGGIRKLLFLNFLKKKRSLNND